MLVSILSTLQMAWGLWRVVCGFNSLPWTTLSDSPTCLFTLSCQSNQSLTTWHVAEWGWGGGVMSAYFSVTSPKHVMHKFMPGFVTLFAQHSRKWEMPEWVCSLLGAEVLIINSFLFFFFWKTDCFLCFKFYCFVLHHYLISYMNGHQDWTGLSQSAFILCYLIPTAFPLLFLLLVMFSMKDLCYKH